MNLSKFGFLLSVTCGNNFQPSVDVCERERKREREREREEKEEEGVEGTRDRVFHRERREKKREQHLGVW